MAGEAQGRFFEPGADRRGLTLPMPQERAAQSEPLRSLPPCAHASAKSDFRHERDTGDGGKADLMCVRDLDSYGVEIGRVVQTGRQADRDNQHSGRSLDGDFGK